MKNGFTLQFAILGVLILLGFGCNGSSSESSGAAPATDSTTNGDGTEIEIPEIELVSIALADRFDFPVGPPDAKLYYNAQGFQENNHLGEDWNGVGGGNSDKGDPVYSVANGLVITAEDFGEGWGNVVRVLHNIGTQGNPKVIESVYAHLDKMTVNPNQTVHRGQQIGNIGDADGAYWAHLHLEMRWKTGMPIGGGYSQDTAGFLVPTKFIKAHRN